MEEKYQIVTCDTKSRPLLTAKQLLNWKKYIGDAKSYKVLTKADLGKKDSKHEMLLCHDMQGGYLDDA